MISTDQAFSLIVALLAASSTLVEEQASLFVRCYLTALLIVLLWRQDKCAWIFAHQAVQDLQILVTSAFGPVSVAL